MFMLSMKALQHFARHAGSPIVHLSGWQSTAFVGLEVGAADGLNVGTGVGEALGEVVGCGVGFFVGVEDGATVGLVVGEGLGAKVDGGAVQKWLWQFPHMFIICTKSEQQCTCAASHTVHDPMLHT